MKTGAFFTAVGLGMAAGATVALMLLVPVSGAPLLGHFGVVLANVLMYIAVVLTIVSGAEYIIKNYDCIRDM